MNINELLNAIHALYVAHFSRNPPGMAIPILWASKEGLLTPAEYHQAMESIGAFGWRE